MSTTTTPVYYDKGSCELAVETPVMMKRLEKVSSCQHGSPQDVNVLKLLDSTHTTSWKC